MLPRDLAFVGSRLLALFVLATSLQSIVLNTWFLLQGFHSQDHWSVQDKIVEWSSYVVPMAALLALVAFLWLRAGWIAEKVAGHARALPSPPIPEGWSPQRVLSVAVVILGVWILFGAIPALVSYLLWFVHTASGHGGASELAFGQTSRLVSTLLSAGLGLLCIFGAQRIAEFIGAVRRL